MGPPSPYPLPLTNLTSGFLLLEVSPLVSQNLTTPSMLMTSFQFVKFQRGQMHTSSPNYRKAWVISDLSMQSRDCYRGGTGRTIQFTLSQMPIIDRLVSQIGQQDVNSLFLPIEPGLKLCWLDGYILKT